MSGTGCWRLTLAANVICATILCKEPSLWRLLLHESEPLSALTFALRSVSRLSFADMCACCMFQGEQGQAHTGRSSCGHPSQSVACLAILADFPLAFFLWSRAAPWIPWGTRPLHASLARLLSLSLSSHVHHSFQFPTSLHPAYLLLSWSYFRVHSLTSTASFRLFHFFWIFFLPLSLHHRTKTLPAL